MTTAKTPGIYAAMGSVMAEIGSIGKDQKNVQQGFKFRGIDQVYNVLHGLMSKHGIFCTSDIIGTSREERTTQRGGVLAFTTVTVRFTFHCTADGSSVASTVVGEGMDSGDKSTPKAMAIAHKYALLQCFLIPTEESVDPDYETHQVAPRGQKRDPRVDKETLMRLTTTCDANGFPKEKVCRRFGVDSLDQLTSEQAQTAIAGIESMNTNTGDTE